MTLRLLAVYNTYWASRSAFKHVHLFDGRYESPEPISVGNRGPVLRLGVLLRLRDVLDVGELGVPVREDRIVLGSPVRGRRLRSGHRDSMCTVNDRYAVRCCDEVF